MFSVALYAPGQASLLGDPSTVLLFLTSEAAFVLPFAAEGLSAGAVAQSVIHLVIGLVIGSLVTGAAASASRPAARA